MPTYLVARGRGRDREFLVNFSPICWGRLPDMARQYHGPSTARHDAAIVGGMVVVWKYSGAVVPLDHSSRP